MTYEKEIPAYALQVARAPKVVRCPAIYHTEKLISPGEKQTVSYQFEEDILVPDTKEDMQEILLMDAVCDVIPAEKKLSSKNDELLNLTGTITIQTLYRPEQNGSLPIAILSKIPYKYQWTLPCAHPAEGVFDCKVKNLDYLVINERKFRVKVTLEFTCSLFLAQECKLFQALENDTLETKSQSVPVGSLVGMKREDIQIDETIQCTDPKQKPEEILRQQFRIWENYRQVTTEKIVINGFITADLLYRGRDDEGEVLLWHRTERLEFTHFIPLGKELRGRKWSMIQTQFCHPDLVASLSQKEGEGHVFRINGQLQLRVAMYEEQNLEVVVDAYHRQKEFTCSYKRHSHRDLICDMTTEATIREVLSLPEGSKGQEVVFSCCYPSTYETQTEKGQILLRGNMAAVCIWRDEEGYQRTRVNIPFQQTIEAEQILKDTEVELNLQVKSCRATGLSERKVELICSLGVVCQGYETKTFVLLEEPAFVEGGAEKKSSMVITTINPGESLWDLAKRHRTTEAQIQQINQLEGKTETGQKILIIK